jgi:hypothetical protein
MTVKAAPRVRKYHQPWIPSQQGWTWIITIVWMTIANIWKPFGLYGFVCMFTPIGIALSGRGKMHCARICPRGSFIAGVLFSPRAWCTVCPMGFTTGNIRALLDRGGKQDP